MTNNKPVNDDTAARRTRRRRRHLAIAGLTGLAAALSVLAPAGEAAAGATRAIGAEHAVEYPAGYTAEQYLAYERSRIPSHVRELRMLNAVPAARDTRSDDLRKTPRELAHSSGTQEPGSGSGPAGSVFVSPGTASWLNDCHVDFNEKSVLQFLPNHAQDTFVEWPFWAEECTGTPEGNIGIRPKGSGHYHLGYEDLQIAYCADLDAFGRHIEPRPVNPTNDEFRDWIFSPCTEIDPVAETRSNIQPHSAGYAIEIYAYETVGGRLPMTLNSIQIVSGTSELCYLGSGEWISEAPGDSPWQCIELGVGHWNMSAIADDVMEIRVTALTENNAIDNIAADIL